MNPEEQMASTDIPGPTTRHLTDHRPELLAPAGDFESLRAAIRNGADAVYLGAGSFNARQKAVNFGDSLQEAIDEAHRHALRVYLTLNTLVTDDELEPAVKIAEEAYIAGVDGVIMQDIGLIRMVHQNLPDLPLFASTQMSIGDEAGLRAAARLGLKRVILARELSLAEIMRLSAVAHLLNLEAEVFIHGALCISLSGQCLMSSLNGGRSGNRGACAQPCRLPWHLTLQAAGTSDKSQEAKAAGNGSSHPIPAYPALSPRDQALYAHLAALSQAGVSSLKIEGRMRSAAYVGQVVSVYRELLDRMDQPSNQDQLSQAHRRLLRAFNRGGAFNDRYLTGRMEANFLSGKTSGSHGVLLGLISKINSRSGEMAIQPDLAWPDGRLPGRGDVLSVRRPDDAEETASAPIGAIRSENGQLMMRGFHPDVLGNLQTGDPVYCMTDREAEKKAEQADRGRTEISLSIEETLSGMISLTATVLNGPQTGMVLTLKKPSEAITAIAPERLDQQLRKAGQTVFRVVATEQSGDIPLGIGSLNDLRRQLLEQLTKKIEAACHRTPKSIKDISSSPNTGIKAQSEVRYAAGHADAQVAGHNVGQDAQVRQDAHVRNNHQTILSAYFYRLPANPAEIPCGADEYLLPILSLTPTLAPDLIRAIKDVEPASRVLAWLPPFMAGKAADILPPLIESLPKWGFDGILAIQAGPDIATLPDGFSWQIDSGANITNSASLKYWADLGADTVALSHELDSDLARRILIQTCLSSPLTVTRPLYGHLRVMTNVFCPVGQNLPGCRRCFIGAPGERNPDPGSLYTLEDRRQLAFPLLTHPRDCHVEILQHSILCVPQHILDLQLDQTNEVRQGSEGTHSAGQTVRINARLYFLNETSQDRHQLISQARDLIAIPSIPRQMQQRQIAAVEAFTDTAAAIARRTDSKLYQELPISLQTPI